MPQLLCRICNIKAIILQKRFHEDKMSRLMGSSPKIVSKWNRAADTGKRINLDTRGSLGAGCAVGARAVSRCSLRLGSAAILLVCLALVASGPASAAGQPSRSELRQHFDEALQWIDHNALQSRDGLLLRTAGIYQARLRDGTSFKGVPLQIGNGCVRVGGVDGRCIEKGEPKSSATREKFRTSWIRRTRSIRTSAKPIRH